MTQQGSSDPDGTIVLYEWLDDMGNVAATGASLVIPFPPGTAASFDATLRVTDNDGATDELTLTITILAAPSASWFWSATADELTADATGSSDPDGTIVLYEWLDALGNVTTTGSFIVVPFPPGTVGSFDATLRVTDNDGATDELTLTITLPPPPNLAPTASWVWDFTGGQLTLNATGSSDPDGTIVLHEWLDSSGNRLLAGDFSRSFEAFGASRYRWTGSPFW